MGGLIKPVHLGFENPETGKLSRRAMLLVRCFGFGQAHQSKKSVGPNQSSNSTVSKTANFLASHVASPPSSWSSLPRSVVACLASTDSLYRVVFPSWPRMAITVAVGHAALGQPASHKDDDARTGNGDRGLLLPFSKFVRNGESWLSPAALSLHPPLSLSLSPSLSLNYLRGRPSRFDRTRRVSRITARIFTSEWVTTNRSGQLKSHTETDLRNRPSLSKGS